MTDSAAALAGWRGCVAGAELCEASRLWCVSLLVVAAWRSLRSLWLLRSPGAAISMNIFLSERLNIKPIVALFKSPLGLFAERLLGEYKLNLLKLVDFRKAFDADTV